MKRRQRQEEKKRLREENLEKKKESKFSLPSVNIANPLEDIFSSIGNFFLYLGGGMLFNKIYDAEKGLMGVAKLIEGIGKGIDFVASMVGSLTNFIDSTVSGLEPPVAFATVVTVIPVTPSILEGELKDEAPFASVLFVTTYCSVTILPSDKPLLTTPSPK